MRSIVTTFVGDNATANCLWAVGTKAVVVAAGAAAGTAFEVTLVTVACTSITGAGAGAGAGTGAGAGAGAGPRGTDPPLESGEGAGAGAGIAEGAIAPNDTSAIYFYLSFLFVCTVCSLLLYASPRICQPASPRAKIKNCRREKSHVLVSLFFEAARRKQYGCPLTTALLCTSSSWNIFTC